MSARCHLIPARTQRHLLPQRLSKRTSPLRMAKQPPRSHKLPHPLPLPKTIFEHHSSYTIGLYIFCGMSVAVALCQSSTWICLAFTLMDLDPPLSRLRYMNASKPSDISIASVTWREFPCWDSEPTHAEPPTSKIRDAILFDLEVKEGTEAYEDPLTSEALLSSSSDNDECDNVRFSSGVERDRGPNAESVFVASCPPHSVEWRHCGAAEQLKTASNATTLGINEDVLNSHDTSHMSLPTLINAPHIWTPATDDEILRALFRDRRNIVIDSITPEKTPHIVITGSEDTFDARFASWYNRIEPQRLDNLAVPSYDVDVAYPRSTPEARSLNYPATTDSKNEPNRVFSHSRFITQSEISSTERLVMYHVVTALQRHQCKAAAYAASSLAPSFRERYDSPEFVHSLESPFQWTDPAEPLLANSKYHLGTTVIESSCPFTAPHIIINAPPPQSPWIAWQNATSDPQDSGHGQYLVVPSRSVTVINTNTSAQDYWATSSQFSVPNLIVDPFQSPALSTGISSPETPLDDDDDYFGISEHDMADAVMISDGGLDETSSCGLVMPALGTADNWCPADFSRPSCCAFAPDEAEDEDEDGLPPFDDWYQSVADRTQVA